MSDLTPERLDQIEKAAKSMPTFWGADTNGIYDRDETGSERYLALIPGVNAVAGEYFRVTDPETMLALIAEVKALRETVEQVRTQARETFNELPRDAHGVGATNQAYTTLQIIGGRA